MVCASLTLPMNHGRYTSYLAIKFRYTMTLILSQGIVAAWEKLKRIFCVYLGLTNARRLIKMSWGRVRIVTAPPVVLTGRSHGSDDSSCIVNRQRSWSPWPCLHGLFKSPPAGHVISTWNTLYHAISPLLQFYFSRFFPFFARFVLECRYSMYRSLYAFRSAEPNSLHFAAGESFLILERSNKHWWLGSRCTSGETGYIPASYIEKIQVITALSANWQDRGRKQAGWWSSHCSRHRWRSQAEPRRHEAVDLMRSRETDAVKVKLVCGSAG